MTKYFIVELAAVAITITAAVYRKSWLMLGRVFQLSFFATLLFIPVFHAKTGYGYGQSSGEVALNLLERTLAIIGNPYGVLQYALLALSVFCAVVVLRKNLSANRGRWIVCIAVDVLFYLILTIAVYDHSHYRFAFG